MHRVNLLPEEFRAEEEKRKIKNSLVVAFLPVLICCGIVHALLLLQINGLEKAKLLLEDSSSKQGPVILESDERISRMRPEIESFLEDNEEIVNTFVGRFPVAELLKIIGDTARGRVWLTNLSCGSADRVCNITGKAFGTRLVSEFMLDIKRRQYFDSVELISVEQGKDKSEKEVRFNIVCGLR